MSCLGKFCEIIGAGGRQQSRPTISISRQSNKKNIKRETTDFQRQNGRYGTIFQKLAYYSLRYAEELMKKVNYYLLFSLCLQISIFIQDDS